MALRSFFKIRIISSPFFSLRKFSSSSVLEPELITSLLELKQQLEDNIVQKEGFRATHTFSAIIWKIDKFVKKYFSSDILEFDISDFEKYLHDDMKKDVKKGRIIQSS
jgi:hypothetical protein